MILGALQVLDPIIGLAVNILLQVAVFKFSSRHRLLQSVFYGFAGGLFILLLSENYMFLNHPRSLYDSIAVSFVNLTTYSALAYCYFHFINLGETARRVRILRELYAHEEGLSETEILGIYNAKEIIDRRIKRLLDNGQLIYKDGKYRAGKNAMVIIAGLILIMRSILFKNISGNNQ